MAEPWNLRREELDFSWASPRGGNRPRKPGGSGVTGSRWEILEGGKSRGRCFYLKFLLLWKLSLTPNRGKDLLMGPEVRAWPRGANARGGQSSGAWGAGVADLRGPCGRPPSHLRIRGAGGCQAGGRTALVSQPSGAAVCGPIRPCASAGPWRLSDRVLAVAFPPERVLAPGGTHRLPRPSRLAPVTWPRLHTCRGSGQAWESRPPPGHHQLIFLTRPAPCCEREPCRRKREEGRAPWRPEDKGTAQRGRCPAAEWCGSSWKRLPDGNQGISFGLTTARSLSFRRIEPSHCQGP